MAPDVRLRGSYFTTRQDEVFDGVVWYGPEGEDVNEEGRQEDWAVYILAAVHWICSIYEVGRIPVFDIWFMELGFRLPFTDLQVAIFDHLRLAPSQLHPNAIAFIRAFKIVCEYLEIGATLPLFFDIFYLHQGSYKTDGVVRRSWVSFQQQNEKLFKTYQESV